MPDPDAVASLVASAFSIAKDATVTGLMFWFVRMLLTGDVVRKGELEAANTRTEAAQAEAKYWRDEFHKERQTAKEAIASLRETIETALRVGTRGRS